MAIENPTGNSITHKMPPLQVMQIQIKDFERQIINLNSIAFDQADIKPKVISFIPKNLTLNDPSNQSINSLTQNASNIEKTTGIGSQEQNSLSKIQLVHHRYWNATHQNSRLSIEEKNNIINEYERLSDTIYDLLNIKLESNADGEATIFGFPLGKANLSDGQKVLIQLAVAIHCQGGSLSDTVIVLDEPENHLHPGAIIDFLERLISKNINGQIWIATHSIAILAHFSESGSLWFMENGTISPAGKNQEIVLNGLLGDQLRINRQIDFLQSPIQVALLRYAQQCLCPPEVIMTGSKDPQVAQINKAIHQLYSKSGKLKTLDFGAGKGRLLANLIADSDTPETITEKIDYIAFDTSPVHRATCEAQIKSAYGDSTNRWARSHSELLSMHNKESFHIIIMCNVLHEISPSYWTKLFGPNGEITELLVEGGFLLLVEDHHLPIGENAHEYGFIILDTGALKDLFNIRGTDDPILSDSQRNGRLKAHLISKNHLIRHNENTQRNALIQHQEQASGEIQRLRSLADKSTGRLFAFWVHQFANATLALKEKSNA